MTEITFSGLRRTSFQCASFEVPIRYFLQIKIILSDYIYIYLFVKIYNLLHNIHEYNIKKRASHCFWFVPVYTVNFFSLLSTCQYIRTVVRSIQLRSTFFIGDGIERSSRWAQCLETRWIVFDEPKNVFDDVYIKKKHIFEKKEQEKNLLAKNTIFLHKLNMKQDIFHQVKILHMLLLHFLDELEMAKWKRK